MQTYTIKINYITGDSYHSEKSTDYIDFEWANLDIAKDNLQRIKEHYIQYKELNGYSGIRKSRNDIFKQNIEKPWFVNAPKLFCISTNNAIDDNESNKIKYLGDWEYRPDEHFAIYCINFITDDTVKFQYSAWWCGYFETLLTAEIEINNSNMKISFE